MKKTLTLIFFLSSATVFSQSGSWAWMNGNNYVNGTATWGTQGVFDAANTPTATYESAEWRDKDGNFWLFGGLNSNEMNMLWKYDRSINQWAWMKGSQNCCQNGVYGTQTVPAAANHPGARAWGAITWTDTTGNLWLFGGYGYDKLGIAGNMNDVWKYDPLTNEWAWMHGSEFNGVTAFYGTLGVADPLNTPGNRCEFAASWTDCSTNTLWLFGGWNFNGIFNDVWKYDIATNSWTWMKGSNFQGASAVYGTKGVAAPANTPSARRTYCKWKGLDGNFWIFGGYDGNTITYNDLWKFDPLTNDWTWMSGPNTSNDNGTYNSYCDPDSTTYPASRFENRACWTDADGKLWLFGGMDENLNPYADLWYFNIPTHEWTWVNGPSTGGSDAWGTQGVASPLNHPGPRAGSVTWSDDSSHLWLFGGKNFSTYNSYNDLWKFIPDSGCGASATIGFPAACAVQLLPESAFTSNESTGCPGSCFDFMNTSINASSYQWLFPGGNPSSSTDQNPQNICYANPGSFDVTLIASSAFASDTLTLTGNITIYSPLSVSVSQNGNYLTCNPAATSYQWDLNGNAIPGATSQVIFVDQTGTYTVSVIDSNGCSSTATIIVSSLPSPGFNAGDPLICEKFCIDFTDQSTNNPTAWQWLFPGGSPATSALQNPTICYNNPGSYDVTLITTSANGNDTLTLPDYITVYPTPGIPSISQSGYTLTSTAAANYQWQFNNVDIPGATNQSYNVTQTGYYTVFITDQNGCSSSATMYVLITGVDEIFSDANILVYPNPSDGSFIVELFNCLIAGHLSIEIVNTLGQVVYLSQEKIFSSDWKKNIDLHDVARGMYFIELKTEDHFIKKKIIVSE